MVLFYDADTRSGAIALIDDGGQLQEQHEFDPGTFGVFTHLVSDGRFILFYNADTRSGAIALIDDGGQLQEQHEFDPGTFGVFTHLVSDGGRRRIASQGPPQRPHAQPSHHPQPKPSHPHPQPIDPGTDLHPAQD
jgi:chromosomal replication initiation ATPase DnaA